MTITPQEISTAMGQLGNCPKKRLGYKFPVQVRAINRKA
jgi:IS30 family transposase